MGHVCILFGLAITVKLQHIFGFRLGHLQGYLFKIFHEKVDENLFYVILDILI